MTEDMRARDTVITKQEMENMYKYNRRIFAETKDSKEPRMEDPLYSTLDSFTKKVMEDYATVSHGDIVLKNHGIEIARVKGKYTSREDFVHLDDHDIYDSDEAPH